MPLTSSPTVRRERLGAELRQLRKDAGLIGDQVIERLGWASASKLSRIEKGQSRPDLADVMDLLDLYGVTGAKREELIAVARDAANTRGWWRAFGDMHQRQRGYAELEAGAAEIREYQQFLVPGLLQTPGYTRIRSVSVRDFYSGLDLDAEVRGRQARQRVLTQDEPPRYEVIIEEPALRRTVAPPEVMREQLQHLVDVADRPNVTLRVLPLDAKVGDFYVPHTAFSLYRYPDPADPETVALETLASDVHLGDEEDVAPYKLAFGWVRDAALSQEESAAFVAKLACQPKLGL